MNQSITNLQSFRSGIYLHYKRYLYDADHLTHNASEKDRVEVHYVGLQLEKAQEGPRHATREFNEFLFDKVHRDGSKCEHGIKDRSVCMADEKITERFRYLGPIFETWMLHTDPWD